MFIYYIVGVNEIDKLNMVNLVCCNLNATNIYNFTFNRNQSFIKKNNVHNFQTLT